MTVDLQLIRTADTVVTLNGGQAVLGRREG